MKCVGVLLALTLCACGGPRSSAAKSESLTEVQHLPAERKALLVAYGRGGDEWEAARAQALADPAATRFLVDNLMLEMMRSYDAFAARTDERARSAFLRAESELARLGPTAARSLVELLGVADGIVADLAARTLVRMGRDANVPLEPALAHADGRVRRRAAELYAELPHAGEHEPEVRAALTKLALGDAEWIVRAESARALGSRGAHDVATAPWRTTLERALVDADATVRRAAADGLGRLGDPRAIPALANAMARSISDGEVKLLGAIEAALGALAGDGHSRSPQDWLDWWRTHGVERMGKRGG
ncbi:MAG: HEAT repeat domain-containing protein [Planctomycetes bacterium]|nr:HEAT repeat domain-containing protein [Planctomycetota bacterium]